MATPGELQAAPEADRSADPLSWNWVDLSDLSEANAVTITRGRSSSRAVVSEPASVTFPLRNGGGDTGVTVGSLTPRKGTGDLYPGIRKGLALRYSVHAGQSWLALGGTSGTRASTPDAASWNLGADGAFAVQFRAPIRFPPLGFVYEIFGQFTTSGNQRAWLLYLAADGTLRLRISSNGTAESDSQTTLGIPSPDAGPLVAAVEFDGDNGAGGNTSTFYVARADLATVLADKSAYTFGDPDVNSGTLSIFNSTADVGIGDVPGSGFAPYPGGIDRVYVRAGTLDSGTVVADADFTAEAAGTTSFADDAATPKTWTLAGDAEITDRKIRLLGEYGRNQGDYPGAAVDGTARRTITVAGPLRRMQRRSDSKPLKSALRRLITSPDIGTTVHAYWPFEDGRDATSLYTFGGNPGGSLTADLAADDTLDASEPLPSVSGGASFGWNLALPPTPSTSTWQFTMLVNIPVAPDAGAGEFLDLCRCDCVGGVTSSWVLRIDDTDLSLFAKDLGGANVLSVSQGSDPRMFGTWMIITLSVGLSGSDITWQVDATPTPLGATFTDSGTLASLGLPAGALTRLRNLEDVTAQDGASFGHLIVTTDAVTGWLAPADTAYVGEPAMQRAFRLLREQRIPRVIDGPYGPDWDAVYAAGGQPMGPQRPLPLLTLLEECALASRGWLGEPRELLGVWMRDGSTVLNQSPGLSVDSEVAPHSAFVSVDDDQHYVNDVEVSRPNGSTRSYTAAGIDHPDVAGLYEDARTVNVETDGDLEPHAAWWVHEATWPEERHDLVPVELAVDPSLIDTWHSFSVGDVIEAGSLPSAAERDSTEQVVDGWVETISPGSWQARPNGRPAGPNNVGAVDDSTSIDTDAARVDSAYTTLTGSLSNSATGGQSVTVASPGATWTTDSAYFPMNVRIDEETVTLSGITGASSPQTFTISARGVDGTDAAAHAAGAEIHPAFPLRAAPSKRFR